MEFTDGGNLWYRLLYKEKINTSEKKDLKEKCLGGRLIVRNCHNHGMMLGILKNKDKEFLRDLASMVLGGAIWEYIRTSGEKGTRISKLGLSMILGGGLNNYTERRRKGYVTDYASLNVENPKLKKVVFNISDLFIFTGALLWGGSEIFSEKEK